MRNHTNKKGIAMLLVAGLVVVAVPVTMLLFNLSKTQKEQTLHYNNVLNVEQISLSGINMGYSRLKSGYDRGYHLFPGEISGKDRYDLNMTQTGTGFFNQDIYLLLSKAKEGKNRFAGVRSSMLGVSQGKGLGDSIIKENMFVLKYMLKRRDDHSGR